MNGFELGGDLWLDLWVRLVNLWLSRCWRGNDWRIAQYLVHHAHDILNPNLGFHKVAVCPKLFPA